MAQVPSKYPVEPGASRCGDSYPNMIFADGELPGAGFGRQFSETIKPVYFQGSLTRPASIPNLGKNGAETHEFYGDVRDRIDAGLTALQLYDHVPELRENTPSLRALLLRAGDELDGSIDDFEGFVPALPPEPGAPIVYPAALQARVVKRFEDALAHLRCADYWTARLRMYSQAKEAYVPPGRDPTAFFTSTPGEPLTSGFAALPPLPRPDSADGGIRTTPGAPQPWKAAAVVGAGAVVVFFLLR